MTNGFLHLPKTLKTDGNPVAPKRELSVKRRVDWKALSLDRSNARCLGRQVRKRENQYNSPRGFWRVERLNHQWPVRTWKSILEIPLEFPSPETSFQKKRVPSTREFIECPCSNTRAKSLTEQTLH